MSNKIVVTSRRSFMIASGGAAAALAFLPTLGQAADNNWAEVMESLVGTSSPAEGRVSLSMPEIAENGNVVPFDVSVDSPMTADDHVSEIHVLAGGNPTPLVNSNFLTAALGKAALSSRMRLGSTQDIYAVAKMSNGDVYGTKVQVKVTIGGCGG